MTRIFLRRLPTVVKIRNRGQKEPVCSDEPQKRLTSLAQSLKAPPLDLYPENLRIHAETAPKQIQYLVSKFPCPTIAFLVYLIQPKASSYQSMNSELHGYPVEAAGAHPPWRARASSRWSPSNRGVMDQSGDYPQQVSPSLFTRYGKPGTSLTTSYYLLKFSQLCAS
jgi:hypothetical protein